MVISTLSCTTHQGKTRQLVGSVPPLSPLFSPQLQPRTMIYEWNGVAIFSDQPIWMLAILSINYQPSVLLRTQSESIPEGSA